MNTAILVSSFISFCLGIIYFNYFGINLIFCVCVVVVFLVGLGFLFYKKRNPSLFVLFILVFFIVGLFRFMNDKRQNVPVLDSKYINQQVVIEGVVYLDPEKKFDSSRIYIKSKLAGKNTNYIANIDQYKDIEYGDKIEIQGKIEPILDFIADNGKIVEYSKLMQKNNVFFQIKPYQIKVLSKNNLSKFKLELYRFKKKLENKFNEHISEPESSFASGIIFGDKSGFSDDFNQSFIRSGTIHIVALSGYNVTILGQFMLNILELFLSFSIACIFGALVIILFVVMTGGQATAVRSAIMGIIALFAKRFGLQNSGLRALLFAGFVMLMINPWLLVYDMSFQLSFLATFGLIVFSPIIEERTKFITTKLQIRYIIATTISATVITFPYLLYKMGYTSIVSLPANLLILPLMFPVMVLSLSGLALAFIGSGLVLKILFYLLKYQIWVSDLFAKLKFAVLEHEIKIWQMIVFYIIIFAVFYLIDRYNRRLKLEEDS